MCYRKYSIFIMLDIIQKYLDHAVMTRIYKSLPNCFWFAASVISSESLFSPHAPLTSTQQSIYDLRRKRQVDCWLRGRTMNVFAPVVVGVLCIDRHGCEGAQHACSFACQSPGCTSYSPPSASWLWQVLWLYILRQLSACMRPFDVAFVVSRFVDVAWRHRCTMHGRS